MAQSFEVCYWRQPKGDRENGPEVDVILKMPDQVVPFEVKFRESAPLDAKSGLAIFCAAEAIERGYLITKSDHAFGPASLDGHATRFMKVPAPIFTYVAGLAEQAETTAKEGAR